ncbi:MAG: hypothetical protein Q7U10_05060 [Thermodesulfovibrionia bacterium]|nr:hypothetical protein [Thermodesulfovibrionia bacterium]
MNLFFDETGIALAKKSLIEVEALPVESSSEAFKRNWISLGFILKPPESISSSSLISFFALLTAFSSPWRKILFPLIDVSIPRVSSITLRLLSSLSCVDERSLSSPRSSSNLNVSRLLYIYTHEIYIYLYFLKHIKARYIIHNYL